MWFTIAVLVGLTTTAAILFRLTLPVVHDANLGRMSEQWLEEYRASQRAA